jgi:EmrB/QacA subfamily drug resistance transporter
MLTSESSRRTVETDKGDDMSKQETQKASRGVLPLVLASLALVVAAVPALNVALPDVAADTGATQSQLQWIVDSYALVFAGLLLPAGALGDRYGRKPLLILGLLVFGGGSAFAALCATPGPLIAARAVMGIGAAMVMPTTLSVITSSFPVQQRAKAIGAWVGVAGAGAILGLISSGLLLERFGWESVFWLNVVLASGVAALAAKRVPDSRDAHRPSVDVLGGLLLTVALSAVVFAAIEGPELGWADPLTLAAAGGGIVAAALWLVWSLRTPHPLLDPRLFLHRSFSSGVLSIGAQFFVFFGFVFLVIQYVQMVLGYSSLRAGLALLPMAMVLGGLSRHAPHLAARLSRRQMSAGGALLIAGGLLVLAVLDDGSSYWMLLAGIVPLGAGMALATAPATTGIVNALPASKQGVGSAVNDAAREVGGALGIAVLGSILNAVYRADVSGSMPDAAAGHAEAAQDSLPAALAVARRLGDQGPGLADAARDGFTHGMTVAFVASAGLMVLVAVAMAVLNRPDGDEVVREPADHDGDLSEAAAATPDPAMAGSMP